MNTRMQPKSVFLALLFVITFLLLANIGGIVAKFYFDHPYVFGLVPLFNFDQEWNIPAVWSALALLCASLLLAHICVLEKKRSAPFLGWSGLAAIFLFLAFDELTSVHEHTGTVFGQVLGNSGLLFFTWVIPYGIAVIIFACVYLKFLLALPKKIMTLFIISGCMFVAGAVGFELLGGRQRELHGPENIVYALFYTCEEFLEMLGIVIFIYALLLYLSGNRDYSATADAE